MAFLEELCGATVCEDGSGPRFSRKTRCRVLLHRRGIPEGELYSGYTVKVHIPAPSATTPILFWR
ncbi:hypothetical protein DY000_02030614 [Brassica cretica]|uniref:Uncharacterized protein n=1 Tax=Brassica cretica TaxID=69181 RepID=A0ABQ7DY31_BRACR|nr:hypothetical protein DY000_02030614 [Brassica cretica]